MLNRNTHQNEIGRQPRNGILILKREPSYQKRNTHIKKEHSSKGTLIKRRPFGFTFLYLLLPLGNGTLITRMPWIIEGPWIQAPTRSPD